MTSENHLPSYNDEQNVYCIHIKIAIKLCDQIFDKKKKNKNNINNSKSGWKSD